MYLADGLPVLDTAIKFDRDLQCRQRNINEVRAAVNVDFFLRCQPGDPRPQQRKENQGLAGRLATSIGMVDDPTGVPAPSGVAGSGIQSLVEIPPRFLLPRPRRILTETIKLTHPC